MTVLPCDGCGAASSWTVIDHVRKARLEYCAACWHAEQVAAKEELRRLDDEEGKKWTK